MTKKFFIYTQVVCFSPELQSNLSVIFEGLTPICSRKWFKAVFFWLLGMGSVERLASQSLVTEKTPAKDDKQFKCHTAHRSIFLFKMHSPYSLYTIV